MNNPDNKLKLKYKLWAIGNIVIGVLFGKLMAFFGLYSTAGGHSSVLIQIFAAPFGFIFPSLDVIFALIPIWWATMFFVAIWPMRKTLSRRLIILGEYLHFGVAAYGLIYLPKSEWIYILDGFLAFILFSSISLPIYSAGHFYIFWMIKKSTLRQDKQKEKQR